MAKRNEVLTLFGATPEQIMEKQRREQAMMVLQQQDPFARAGSAIGVGLARLFGGESADVIEARKLQGAKEGINLNTSEGMREAAQRLSAAGFEDRALELINMADQRDTLEQTRGLQGQTQVNKEIPVEVPYYDKFNDKMTTKTVMIKVPYQWDPKTQTTTSIFGQDYEDQLKAQAVAEAEAQIQTEVQTPESRTRETLTERINRIPVGGVENIGGRYIRRLGPGPNDIVELTLEEVRRLPTEMDSTVDNPVMP